MRTDSPPIRQHKMDSEMLEQRGTSVEDLRDETGEGLEAPFETVDAFQAALG